MQCAGAHPSLCPAYRDGRPPRPACLPRSLPQFYHCEAEVRRRRKRSWALSGTPKQNLRVTQPYPSPTPQIQHTAAPVSMLAGTTSARHMLLHGKCSPLSSTTLEPSAQRSSHVVHNAAGRKYVRKLLLLGFQVLEEPRRYLDESITMPQIQLL
jgi:hypothetical protein